MEKKKVAIYPFSKELLPIVKYFNELQDIYQLTCVYAPVGSGMEGHDAGFICNHPDTGITIISGINNAVMQWETLLVIETRDKSDSLQADVQRTVYEAIANNKEVVFFYSCQSCIPDWVYSLQKKYPDRIRVDLEPYEGENVKFNKPHIHMNKIVSPVILVGGVIQEADTGELMVQLWRKLKRQGIMASVVMENPVTKLLGAIPIYGTYHNTNMSEPQKIKYLNKVLSEIESEVRPDVFLIEAPDALLQYSDSVPNGFGIWTQMLSIACPPDYIVCGLPYNLVGKNLIECLDSDARKRYGVPIAAAHVSNVVVDMEESTLRRELCYYHINLKKVDECVRNTKKDVNTPIYNIVTEGVEELYDSLI